MKKMKLCIFVLLAMICGQTVTVSAQDNFSPSAKLLKNQYQQQEAKARTTRSSQSDMPTVQFVITCKMSASPVAIGEQLEALGAKVDAVFGRNLKVSIPADQIDAMAATEGIVLIDVQAKPEHKSDQTRYWTGTDLVHQPTGEGLTQAYTGKGVIIGLIDSGFDFTHPVFKDKDGNLRIKSIYLAGNTQVPSEQVTVTQTDQTGATKQVTLKPGVVTDPKVILDTLLVKDNTDTHGTHCAAIAAGTPIEGVYGSKGGLLGGMAPDADLVLCTNQTHDETEIDQVLRVVNNQFSNASEHLAYLKHYAKEKNMPLVVSWSENTHNGWHNGTSPNAQLVESFCKEGNVIVLCTGNEGVDSTYINRKIAKGDSLNVVLYGEAAKGVYYLKTTKPVTVRLGVFDLIEDKEVFTIGSTTNDKAPNDTLSFITSQDPATVDQILASLPEEERTSAQNMIKALANYMSTGYGMAIISTGQALESATSDKTFSYTQVSLLSYAQFAETLFGPNYTLSLHITPQEETEVYSWLDKGDYYTVNNSGYSFAYEQSCPYEKGTNDVNVGDLNTSGAPVSIGAWTAANYTVDKQGNIVVDEENAQRPIGDAADFSSFGIDLAGHVFPDACAPGVNIFAAINSFLPTYTLCAAKDFTGQFERQQKARNYQWGIASGTSMATPAAAGIVALWMQAANDKGKRLTCEDIKTILNHSCTTDAMTNANALRFGYGKIDAYKGLLYVLGLDTGIKELSQHQPDHVTFHLEGNRLYTEGAEDGTPVSLYNLQGVRVVQTTVQGGAIVLDGLAKGVYAVQIGKLGSTLIRL